MTTEIRPAEDEAALTALAALARQIWQAHFPGIISQRQIDYMLLQGYSLPAMRTEIEDGVRHRLAWRAGQPIGYAAHGPDGNEPATLWLHNLYVQANHRRAGVARALLADARTHAEELGCSRIRLRVNRHNRLALGFYRRVGFRVARTDIKDIGNGFVMDDYILARNLAPRQP
ncbi:MAG: GNAT family N-acetyltransferase [Salinisphaera sp.]|nr:GNAT family N-acetyltransferase [Salinisphaera sp.]